MKITRWLTTLALTAGLVMPTAQAALEDPVQMRVASFRVGSSWYVYAVTLGELLREHLPAGSQIDTPPLGGGEANPELVSRGKAAIGLSFAVVNNWAKDGKIIFDQPLDNLRGLFGGLDQYYLGIVANTDKASDSLEQFLDQDKPDTRIMLLRRGSFGSRAGQQLLDLVGSSEEQVDERGGRYDFADFETIKGAFASGSADLFIQVITRGHPAVMEMSQTSNVSFLQPTDETLGKMKDTYGWNTATLDGGAFRGQDDPVKLPGTTSSVIVTADMPEELAYTLVKTVCENLDAFKAGHKALANFDCETKAWQPELIGLPLHPGAERYYREQGWLK